MTHRCSLSPRRFAFLRHLGNCVFRQIALTKGHPWSGMTITAAAFRKGCPDFSRPRPDTSGCASGRSSSSPMPNAAQIGVTTDR